MQVKFRYGTMEKLEEIMKVRPSIKEVRVFYDSEDGSLYFTPLDSKNELKTSFEMYLENELKISFEKSV